MSCSARGQPDGLLYQFQTLKDLGHAGTKPIGTLRGLQYVFAKQEVRLSNTVLEQYVGTYRDEHGVEVYVSVDNGRLMLKNPNGLTDHFRASSEHEFFLKGVNVKLTFGVSEKSITLNVKLFSEEHDYMRVK